MMRCMKQLWTLSVESTPVAASQLDKLRWIRRHIYGTDEARYARGGRRQGNQQQDPPCGVFHYVVDPWSSNMCRKYSTPKPRCPSAYSKPLLPTPTFLLPGQTDAIDLLLRDTLPLLDRNPTNVRPVSKSTNPVDLVHNQAHPVTLVNTISRQPCHSIRMALDEACRKLRLVRF